VNGNQKIVVGGTTTTFGSLRRLARELAHNSQDVQVVNLAGVVLAVIREHDKSQQEIRALRRSLARAEQQATRRVNR
jgi:hypothetical protein